MTPLSQLTTLRKKVELLDGQIITLLGKRYALTRSIQQIKKGIGMPIEQKNREKALLTGYIKTAHDKKLKSAFIKKIFHLIFSYAKKSGTIK